MKFARQKVEGYCHLQNQKSLAVSHQPASVCIFVCLHGFMPSPPFFFFFIIIIFFDFNYCMSPLWQCLFDFSYYIVCAHILTGYGSFLYSFPFLHSCVRTASHRTV